MLSFALLSATILYNKNINVQVESFAPPSLLAEKIFPRRHSNLFSTAEAVERESSSIADSDERLPELFPSLAAPLNELGFSTPTPIQAASSKRALSGENLLLIAPTGSGKTLSYMLPALEKIKVYEKQGKASTVLVVAPTRELALQLMRDTTSILSDPEQQTDNLSVLLAIQGVQMPSTEELETATVLIGTPRELVYVLSEIKGGIGFLAGDVLSSIVLDEVDVLLPNPPKHLRTALDNDGNGRNERKGGKKANTPQDERRRQEQKRKFMAAKRRGVEFDSDKQIVGPTETILKMVAGRRLYSADGTTASTTSSFQVFAGSATASRKTLDRLNKALRNAAMDASSDMDIVWNGQVKPCRPEEGETASEEQQQPQDHTIRAVTVPSQVKHQYVKLGKDVATKPSVVLTAVAKASEVLKPKRALLFLCGEFRKQNTAPPSSKKKITPQGKTIQTRGRQKTLKKKKMEAIAAARAKKPVQGLSARSTCKALAELGIEAKPLHVALGLEENVREAEEAEGEEDDEIPPFLVTFEGSARGLHLDDVDVVFVVGRPSSAAAYLHLAGRVGRSSTSEDGSVVIRPGNVVSFCTAGSSKELNKWTKQVGGTELEELPL